MRTRTLTALAVLGLAATAAAQDETSSPGLQANSTGTERSQVHASSTSANVVTIFTNVPGAPTAAVPGFPGFEFEPGTLSSHFARVFGSPSGNWILTANTDDPSSTNDEVLIVNGTAVLKEGDVAPWDVANNMGGFDTRVQINDTGDYVFAMNLSPTSTNDDYTIKVTAGPTYNVVAQEASPMQSIPTSTYDDTIQSSILLADGTVGLEADGVDGGAITSTTDEIFELGATVVAQEGVTVPAGQVGGATETAENFDTEDLWASANGATTLWQGDLSGSTSTDDVVVVNNVVVLQEGVVIPGSPFIDPIDSSGIVGVSMTPSGTWFARGNNDLTEQDWVVRDGVVVAAVGQPVVPGAAEVWDDTDFSGCFFAHVGNGVGDFIVAGVTDNDSEYNGVVVYNGSQVILREGDPVDLDNDGLFDDGAYFDTFGDDDFYLSDANELYFVATFQDAAGDRIGQGFFSTSIAPCAGGPLVDYGTGCPGSGLAAPAFAALGCPTPGGSLTLAISDGIPASTALLFVGVAPTSIPLAGGCTLLTSPVVQLALPLDATGSITVPAVIPATTPAIPVSMQAFNLDAGVPYGYRATDAVTANIQ